jgi:two-component system NtrC family response regulator
VVNIPSVRDRKDDIPQLLEHFILRFAGHAKPYDPAVLELLVMRSWEDGNVRELQDAVEYLCLKSRGSERIEVSHLGVRYLPSQGASRATHDPFARSFCWSCDFKLRQSHAGRLGTVSRCA